MIVKFFNPSLQYDRIKLEIDSAIQRVLIKGDLILRQDVEIFEERLANFIGTKYAIGLNSGTDALFLSLKAIGIGQGDEVITSSYTFAATVGAIVACGAKPVLVDIEENGMLMDIDKIEITPQTKAIIPVHLAGAMCDMKRIMALAEKHNLTVIEDAAQAIGAEWKGKKTGSIGLTGCFSFYPAKILGCYGDGGAITTNDDGIKKSILRLRDHGRVGRNEVNGWGYNSRLDNLQAAVLNTKMKYLAQWIERRKEIARKYDNVFKEIPQIKSYPSQVYQDYIIGIEDREKLVEYLKEKEIEVLINEYPFPFELSCPNRDKLRKRVLRLPIAPELTDEQVEYVIKSVKEYYGK